MHITIIIALRHALWSKCLGVVVSCVYRHLIDLEKNVLLLFNRSVEHPDKPAQSKYVRVTDYMSKMIIKPHGSYLEVCHEMITPCAPVTQIGCNFDERFICCRMALTIFLLTMMTQK